MLRIMRYERQKEATVIVCRSDEQFPEDDIDIPYFMPDGMLESYMNGYELAAGATLTMLMLDAYYDDITAPLPDDPDRDERVDEIIAQDNDRIEWHIDKNELLAGITMEDDTPGSVVDSWRRLKEGHAALAEGHQQLQEERQAAEFVDSLPSAMRAQPRDTTGVSRDGSVALAIQFVD